VQSPRGQVLVSLQTLASDCALIFWELILASEEMAFAFSVLTVHSSVQMIVVK
jgi:hypothetical protein